MDLHMPAPKPVFVRTSNQGPLPPEEWADLAADKILAVSETAHPAIKEQARVFRGRLVHLIADTIRSAISSDRANLYNALEQAGASADILEIIRRQ